MEINPIDYPKEIIDQYIILCKEKDTSIYVSLFTKKLRELGLSSEQIAGVNKAIQTTCNSCWDADNSCQCWNDE